MLSSFWTCFKTLLLLHFDVKRATYLLCWISSVRYFPVTRPSCFPVTARRPSGVGCSWVRQAVADRFAGTASGSDAPAVGAAWSCEGRTFSDRDISFLTASGSSAPVKENSVKRYFDDHKYYMLFVCIVNEHVLVWRLPLINSLLNNAMQKEHCLHLICTLTCDQSYVQLLDNVFPILLYTTKTLATNSFIPSSDWLVNLSHLLMKHLGTIFVEFLNLI